MSDLNEPLSFKRGNGLKNRFMLAPMTNQQSHDDGRLSDDEYHWLVKRAEGGYGLVMTCATNVQANGKTWPGQLGAFSDNHIEGLTRLAAGIKAHGGHACLQLYHGGWRAEPSFIGGKENLRAPSDEAESGAKGMTIEEVRQLRDDFIAAAVRCEKAGFNSVEIHAAHGFAICQFLSPQFNQREDEYGGTPEKRARILHEIIDGIRAACGEQFGLGVRLSPENNGLVFIEMRALAKQLLAEEKVDFVDMSMHDAFKLPNDENYQSKTISEWYLELPRDAVRMGICGTIRQPDHVRKIKALGADFVTLGRAAIMHHDFPKLMTADPAFEARNPPVAADILRAEGLSETFVTYMKTFPEFVA